MASRINWARGFYRLWVVGSLLWASIVLAFSWTAISDPYVSPHVFIGPEGDVAWSEYSDQARAARELKARGTFVEVAVDEAPNITYLGRNDGNLAEIMEQKAPLMLGFYRAQVSAKRFAEIRQAAGLVFIPPVTLFVAGLVIAWGLRGFLADRDTDAT